ncbi:TetR/AcrR family transcriptional regulator [Natronohydrobacter thiooxidans]|uniref:TetR/AcrR family transcriptional regulator n=1 Tax=Natronohydrobacter thiooxidans TaxID=87172 RepID=UPI0008FF5155|nr:TetR/AcrR family transcriptional regulator [Natronohydrobacter thiooxidans]
MAEGVLDDSATGLRDRKKARRRDEIIAVARDLFARNGIDATTINDIAQACDISAPTVFNYFGSKDGILIAIIDEGTRNARAGEFSRRSRDGMPLPDVAEALFSRIAAQTLAIAGKRVWRYAESSAIRHPNAELSQTYREVTEALIGAIASVFDEYSLTTRAGKPASSAQLAEMLHDLWLPCFIRLITEDAMTLTDHDALVRARVLPLLDLALEDASLHSPRRKTGNPQ